MAEAEQVFGRHARAEPVVDLDERHGLRVDVPVEADDRQSVLDEARNPVGRQHEAVDEDAVDLLRAEERKVLLLALGVALGGAEEHRVTALEGARLDAADEGGVERVRDVREEERDGLRRLRDEAPRDRVRLVAELLDRGVDRGARGRCDLTGPVQGARDGGGRHAGEPRDVVDRRARSLHRASVP